MNASKEKSSKRGKKRRGSGGINSLLGPYLLRLAKTSCRSHKNHVKAVEYARQAVIFFEKSQRPGEKLELILSLQALADAHCKAGELADAVAVLERSLRVEIGEEDLDGARFLARSSIYMQLGDALALMGSDQRALEAYHSALEAQKQARADEFVAETCRFLAKAHVQAMEFDKAQEVCKELLQIHERRSELLSKEEEFGDRKLMALVASGRGDNESALEQLVLARSITQDSSDQSPRSPGTGSLDIASIQACIGDTLASLGRFADAEIAYQAALEIFTRITGESHAAVGSVYLSLADLHMESGDASAARFFCERAFAIFDNGCAHHSKEALVTGLVEAAGVYESLGEADRASALLQRALDEQS